MLLQVIQEIVERDLQGGSGGGGDGTEGEQPQT